MTSPRRRIALPALILIVGLALAWGLGRAFLSEARDAWRAQGEQVAEWLSGTTLNWLEESYAPVSGLGALLKNSNEVTEVEFLDAFDALESRATAFFLDAAAYVVPDTKGHWHARYTTEALAIWLGERGSPGWPRYGRLLIEPRGDPVRSSSAPRSVTNRVRRCRQSHCTRRLTGTLEPWSGY